ncbi:unnamed protein product, partial [Prorocentrum cordatum]
SRSPPLPPYELGGGRRKEMDLHTSVRPLPRQASTRRPNLLAARSRTDVAYWAWSLLGEMHNVPNARECRGKCALVPGCGAWTWGKARGVDDLSDICFLKGHSAKLQDDSRHKARGVSSGLCGAGAAAEDGSPRMTIVLGSNDVDRAAGRQGAILPMSSIKSPEKSSTAVLSTTVTATTRVATATTTFTSTTANVLTSTTVLTTITTVLTSTLTSETSATYTQTTSTKTPSRATSTTGPIALPEKVDGELFCFAVMVPGSEEQSLLVIAFQNSAGIFNCDMNTIYSSLEFELAPGVVTHKVASDLHCESGGEFNTALNLEIFLEVWRSVVADGDFTRFEWTVKVDPDGRLLPRPPSGRDPETSASRVRAWHISQQLRLRPPRSYRSLLKTRSGDMVGRISEVFGPLLGDVQW